MTLPPVQAPFPLTAPYRVNPAPRPVSSAPLVELDDSWPAALARRLERLAVDEPGVVVRDGEHPELAAAVHAALDLLPGGVGALPLLGVRLSGEHAVRIGSSVSEPATALLLAREGLDLLVTAWLLACSDDLVVLRRRGPGEAVAELLAVAFPSGWPPRRRAGATLLELHAPVADGERLQRAAPALTEALLTKGPLRQHVWGLDPSGRLDHDPSAPDARAEVASADPSRWWLRVERQTSVPLPALGRALFTIRPYLTPLVLLDATQRAVLAAAVSSMSPQALAYKGITELAPDLVAWLS